MGPFFPLLQSNVAINEHGVNRLHKSLVCAKAPIFSYGNLAYSMAFKNLTDVIVCELLQAISAMPEGLNVAIHILGVRLHLIKNDECLYTNKIISIGQELLIQLDFDQSDKNQNNKDYELGNIFEICFKEHTAIANANILCDNLLNAFVSYKTYVSNHTRLLSAIATRQPELFLDVFLGHATGIENSNFNGYMNSISHSPNPLTKVEDSVIIDWCEIDPGKRYSNIAAAIVSFRKSVKEDLLEWTPLSLKLIDKAPDPVPVLDVFKKSFKPNGWSGSRADVMQKHFSLLSNLGSHQNPIVVAWAEREKIVFQNEINAEREWEEKDNRLQNERFE